MPRWSRSASSSPSAPSSNPTRPRPLRGAERARQGRDGGGLSGQGSQDRARGGDQDNGPVAGVRGRRAGRREAALLPRGGGGPAPVAPQHRHHLRHRRGARLLLHRHGAAEGRRPGALHQGRQPAAGRSGGVHLRVRRRCPGLRAPPRRGAPGHQARQHDVPPGERHAEGHRFRHRAAHRQLEDQDRHGARHAVLHVARAARREADRGALGPVLARRDPVPAALRETAVRGRVDGAAHVQDRQRAADRHPRHQPGARAVAGGVRRARAGEKPGRALPDRRGVRRRTARGAVRDGDQRGRHPALSARMDLTQTLEIASCTDPGMVRSHNEDSVAADAANGLVVLADGMGGYNAGEVASGMATTVIVTEMQQVLASARPYHVDPRPSQETAGRQVREQVLKANSSIYQAAQSQPQYAGMGTTLVVTLFYDNRVLVAHLGDSRLYLLRDGKFRQVTRDHSLLQEQIDSGLITPEQAKNAQHKNLVTKALGIDPSVEPEIDEYPTKPGDIYLLCEDGLAYMVEDEDIGLTLQALGGNLKLCAQQLVQMANDNGGRENVSVILVRVLREYAAARGVMAKVFAWLK